MIKSVIWSSMIDYPDNVCTTLFTGVCNFDCEFCYNKGLLKEKELNFEEEILPKLLDTRRFDSEIVYYRRFCSSRSEHAGFGRYLIVCRSLLRRNYQREEISISINHRFKTKKASFYRL